MPYTYIVECADQTLYTGWTTDLAKRLAAHNAGRGGRYTRMRRPVKLMYWEEYATRAAAQQRELVIKRMRVAAKRRLISNFTENNK
jgi:putative endonuclease